MRLPVTVSLIAILGLSACHKAADSGASAAGDPAAGAKALAAAQDFHMQPGLYRTTIDIKQFDMPGMPTAVVNAMKQSMAEKPITYCLTPEDASKGVEALKRGMAKGKCQFDSFNAAGGKLDSSLTCNFDGKGSMHAVSHGTYTDTGSVAASTAEVAMGGAAKMRIEQVTTTTRTGDCPK